MVLTFDFAIAIANASTHTNYLITLLKSGSKMRSDPVFRFLAVSPKTIRVPRKGADPFFDLTHNYTGDQGLRDSPHLYKTLDFLDLAKAHRYLSERGIIAAKPARSTNKFNYLWSASGVASGHESGDPSSQVYPGKFSLADLVDMGRASVHVQAFILDPLAVDSDGALLDHAKCLRGAGHQTSFL